MGIKKSSKDQQSKQPKLKEGKPNVFRRLLKWLLGLFGGFVILLILIFVSFQVSPWPGSLIIRYVFDKGGAHLSEALEKHVPAGVTSVANEHYRVNDKAAYLDVFYPESAQSNNTKLPTIVWVHGGAWVSGNKDEIDNYLQILAARGYTTVGVNYSIAPGMQYPTPLIQVNEALDYLQRNAERLHIDPDQIVLAGDSAGSQIVAQVAAIITSPAYAEEIGIQPTLQADKLKAMLLNCGAYDLNLPNYNDGLSGWFLRTVLWAYSGKKDFLNDPKLRHASVANYVTPQFPPSFITAGNADPLESQSTEFAKKLTSLGVPVSSLFYAENHEPELPHEYQFNLDTQDGRNALEQMTNFLRQYTKQPDS